MPASFPEWLEPMAATLTQDRFGGPDWIFERKIDGIRLLAFKNGDEVRLLSRNRLPQHLPAIADAVRALPAGDARRPRRAPRRIFSGRRFGVRRQDRHRLRHEALARSARAARSDRDALVAVHARQGAAAAARALGAAADRRAGRLHRVDGARQAAAPAAARGPLRQGRARRRPRGAVITHPDKVLFPDDGITKGELASYYEAIAPLLVPHIRSRPVTMERYPAGIGQKGFMQKDVSKGFPEWLERAEVPKKGGTVHDPLVRDTRSLLGCANQISI